MTWGWAYKSRNRYSGIEAVDRQAGAGENPIVIVEFVGGYAVADDVSLGAG